MKTRILLTAVLLLVGLLVVYQGLSFADTVTLKGTIIDNACAAGQGDIASFIKAHTKSCALMPACEASGYSIFSDGKLYRFDEASSSQVAEFLKKTDSKLDVVVKAEDNGGMLKLVSIENQK